MRLTVVTFGSEGDTRPLGALCRGLIDRGHEVRLFAEGSTLSYPRALGVACEPLSGDLQAALPQPSHEMRVLQVWRAAHSIKAVIADNSADWLRAVGDHARDSDAILLSSLAVGIGTVLSEEFKKPAIGLFFQPLTPTAAFSSPMLPPLPLPGWLKRASFRMSLGQMWWTCGQPAEAARLEVFGHRGQRRDLDFPVLYGCSRELVAQPTDWPADHLICGHWSRPVQEWQAPAALLEFLAAGEAPIYAGFGSASRVMRPKVMHALIDAIAGRRTIFGPGWSQVEASGLPRNFFVAGNVPHEWLFPRASMVIHHGGAGTTHTAARAGVPQIILPVGADQYFWASRVAARGAAPAHTIGAALRASTIARMIRDCQQGEMQRCARALGAAMAQEDGIAVAIARIEHSVASAAG